MPRTLVWFRQDLRTTDNPALAHAAARGDVVPVYVLDTVHTRRLGGASRWWLHHSLTKLAADLGGMVIRAGDPAEILEEVARTHAVDAVSWNRCYEPDAVARDTALKSRLGDQGLQVRSFNAGLLHEPWDVATKSGTPFKVFTPFWRALRNLAAPAPGGQVTLEPALPPAQRDDPATLALPPEAPNWAAGWQDIWTPGETGAHAQLDRFVDRTLAAYAADRDRPDRAGVSRLSPHLHFGEISPRQVWARTAFASADSPGLAAGAEKFLSEVAWREFSAHLLYHFPELPTANWKPAFDHYPWRDDEIRLTAWQRGETGYPLVDAGMRELWRTGYMHNRVRMIAASFLIKHLRIDWRRGEAWFWDTLVDADMANNAAGWQWVAGSGADASPYFRIFNPITQGRKFDPDGDYVRRWCPELAALPNKYVHAPFEAPAGALAMADVKLGDTYPMPIVDHAAARARALAGYDEMKERAGA